ncbi:MAG TPA: glycine cleavage system protein GcvH [Anaerolineae bacterium]|nr:glycine cleavage system protein GcvH [Anaerolineae bacterium]
MHIDRFEFPDDLYFDAEHGWARVDGNMVTQGMSDFGQTIAKEIVYAEVPRVGREVEQGQTFMSMESGKWVGRVKAVIGGTISEANEELEWEPTLLNESPYDEGWMVKIEMADPSQLDTLMRGDSLEFQAFIQGEVEKYADVLAG